MTLTDSPLRQALLRQGDAGGYQTDPSGWVQARLGEYLWSKQRVICESVARHRRTAVQSCHAVGKSFSASRLTAWWLDTHAPGEAFVVTTAPTFSQVRTVLWREIGKAHRKGHLPGRVNQTEWWINEEVVALGRKPADYDEQAFQGIHAGHVLVIIDEACGVPENLWAAAGSLAANENSRILAIGNPLDSTSHFAKVCADGSDWNVLKIAASESPNFTDEEIPADLRPLLISQTYLDEMEADGCGPGTPLWMARVDGEFPEDAEDSVVRASTVAKCRVPQEPAPEPDPIWLGVDVGGSEHGDKTAIRERRGWKAGRVWYAQSSDPEIVAAKILAAIIESGATQVNIDAIGIGWGIAGILDGAKKRGEHQAITVKVNVGSASSKPARFPRLRDEIWWEVGRLNSEQGLWDLSEIDDRTAADLMAPKWKPTAQGKIQVEPKDETRKRLGRSPDDADALLLAFYGGGSQAAAFMGAWRGMREQAASAEPQPSQEPEPTASHLLPSQVRKRLDRQVKTALGKLHEFGLPVGDEMWCVKCGVAKSGAAAQCSR